MTRSIEPGGGDLGGSAGAGAGGPATEMATASAPCPRCRALEDRIAALEAEVAALRAAGATPAATPPSPSPSHSRGQDSETQDEGLEDSRTPGLGTEALELPRLEFQALRLIPYGWGEGWGLRPSPSRRAWMDDAGHAYHCLPLVIANQWGWQILCPTDVRVSWDG